MLAHQIRDNRDTAAATLTRVAHIAGGAWTYHTTARPSTCMRTSSHRHTTHALAADRSLGSLSQQPNCPFPAWLTAPYPLRDVPCCPPENTRCRRGFGSGKDLCPSNTTAAITRGGTSATQPYKSWHHLRRTHTTFDVLEGHTSTTSAATLSGIARSGLWRDLVA